MVDYLAFFDDQHGNSTMPPPLRFWHGATRGLNPALYIQCVETSCELAASDIFLRRQTLLPYSGTYSSPDMPNLLSCIVSGIGYWLMGNNDLTIVYRYIITCGTPTSFDISLL